MARRTRHEALITALLARSRSMFAQSRALTASQGRDEQGRTWYRIENKIENAAAPVEVYLYAEIGMWGISADMFLDELAPLGARDITLRINSEGGEVFDGVAIYNALQRHAGRINAHVDGLAASAASFIAMAADEIVMEPGSQMMIHDAMAMCFGNEREMERMRDMLARTSDTIAMIYAERAGGDPAAWREVMRGEQWYDGAAAVAAKLADRVGEGRQRDARVEESAPDSSAPHHSTEQTRDDGGRWAAQGDAEILAIVEVVEPVEPVEVVEPVVSYAGLPIAWQGPISAPAPDADEWASALIALTTPEPVSSRADDHPQSFWESV